MRKNLLFLLVLLCIVSCEKFGATDKQPKTNIAAIDPFMEYEVTPREGQTTILTFEKDTLAIASEPITVRVPKSAVKSGQLVESWSTDEIYDRVSSANSWQYLLFEDTRFADYDYNDLVIHVRFKSDKKYNKQEWSNTISIQPVALGSSATIKLGIMYKEQETGRLVDVILIEDVRAELFGNDVAFPINTSRSKPVRKITDKLTPYFSLTTSYPLQVVWFIEASGERFYAATSCLAEQSLNMISPDGLPYGISSSWKMDYPVEYCYIGNAYPGFYEWVQTGVDATLTKGKVAKNTFPAIENHLWDYAL